MVRIEEAPDDRETVDEIFRIAHSMKGMSATMGFAGMAALTHEMEDVFELLRQRSGGLERAAIYASLVAGWPEGIAVVLAVKGLGRYPELRAAEDGVRTGAAERFIIGTFASVLWACAAAGVVLLVP